MCIRDRGKALGGGSGGFTSGKKEIIDILRQKSRPYLFSNTLAPSIVGASLKAIDLIENNNSIIEKLKNNTMLFREKMSKLGFDIKGETHPIVPVMIYNDKTASLMSDYLLKKGIYVVGFSYPVVPKGLSRIRVQISSSHSKMYSTIPSLLVSLLLFIIPVLSETDVNAESIGVSVFASTIIDSNKISHSGLIFLTA